MRETGAVTARGKQDWGDWDRADEKGLTLRGQRTRGWKRYGRGKDGSVVQGESAAAGEGERREAKIAGG